MCQKPSYNKIFSLIYQCLFALVVIASITSCRSIKQSNLFTNTGGVDVERFEKAVGQIKKGYVIQKFDVLAISIFPNNGEQIIDQTGDYPGGAGGNNMLGMNGQNGNGGIITNNVLSGQEIAFNNARPTFYSIDENGMVSLPIIGKRMVEGLTLVELDSILSKDYASYVIDPYVLSEFINKRVVVMGVLGDHVVPLQNGGITLVELLARISGGADSRLQRTALTNNIKIIRGEEGSRQIMNADLTTMAGLNKLQITIQPNDIIYVPPRRRLDRETLSDVNAILSPLLSTIGFVATILALINR